ncbi:MAG: AMP-binding protein [Cellvibrionaceae bacterium]|nr:AMP-binding protein [Cellvibrionaceae bacterium]
MEHLAGAWEGMESLESAERTNYPLALAVNDLGERFELSAQVKVGIGADRICEYMRNAVEEITEALANRSDNALCNLSIISQEEISQLLKWSINNKTIMDSLPVHQLFELQAEKRPDATAVLFQDHILTYADLNIRSNQLAHHLIRLGVKPEAKIAIVLERSFDMIIGLLGILKAGAAYVPIDPGYPQERIAHILADSGVELLLTRRDLSHSLPDVIIENEIKENGIAKLELDAIDFSDEPDHNPQMLLTGDNLMYVIYTSGSTGKTQRCRGDAPPVQYSLSGHGECL